MVKSLYLPKYAILEIAIRENPHISPAAKIYFGELAVLAKRDDIIYATDKQLSEMKQVDERTIQKWHKELEDQRFLLRISENITYRDETGKQLWKKKRKMIIFQDPSKNVFDTEQKCGINDTEQKFGIDDTEQKCGLDTRSLKQDLKNNNNSNPKLVNAAAVFPSLKNLDIEESEKQWIMRNYSEKEIAAAVDWIESNEDKITTTLVKALKWACKTQPKVEEGQGTASSSKSSRIDLNKNWTESYIDRWGNESLFRVRTWDSWAEVKVNDEWIRIDYREFGYEEQFMNLLRKGEWI